MKENPTKRRPFPEKPAGLLEERKPLSSSLASKVSKWDMSAGPLMEGMNGGRAEMGGRAGQGRSDKTVKHQQHCTVYEGTHNTLATHHQKITKKVKEEKVFKAKFNNSKNL